jgi:hypothetical protein
VFLYLVQKSGSARKAGNEFVEEQGGNVCLILICCRKYSDVQKQPFFLTVSLKYNYQEDDAVISDSAFDPVNFCSVMSTQPFFFSG